MLCLSTLYVTITCFRKFIRCLWCRNIWRYPKMPNLILCSFVEFDSEHISCSPFPWAEFKLTRQNDTERLTKQNAKHRVPAISEGKFRFANSINALSSQNINNDRFSYSDEFFARFLVGFPVGNQERISVKSRDNRTLIRGNCCITIQLQWITLLQPNYNDWPIK